MKEKGGGVGRVKREGREGETWTEVEKRRGGGKNGEAKECGVKEKGGGGRESEKGRERARRGQR